MPAIESPYEILGVEPSASAKELRRAYLRRVKEHPPERDPEGFRRVREAYEAIRDGGGAGSAVPSETFPETPRDAEPGGDELVFHLYEDDVEEAIPEIVRHALKALEAAEWNHPLAAEAGAERVLGLLPGEPEAETTWEILVHVFLHLVRHGHLLQARDLRHRYLRVLGATGHVLSPQADAGWQVGVELVLLDPPPPELFRREMVAAALEGHLSEDGFWRLRRHYRRRPWQMIVLRRRLRVAPTLALLSGAALHPRWLRRASYGLGVVAFWVLLGYAAHSCEQASLRDRSPTPTVEQAAP